MKKLVFLLLRLLALDFVSSAEAINISLADVENGVAVVQGGKAAPNATITWEGGAVTTSNKNGGFSFSGVVPSDCTGTLSDGVTTIDALPLTNCTPVSSSAPAPVPRTGQTNAYIGFDDGWFQRGVAWPNPRFIDNNNGTITDNLTGLVWLKYAHCSFFGADWASSFNLLSELNSSGSMGGQNCGDMSNSGNWQTDWRFPNLRELQSLVDYEQFAPALPAGHPFLFFQNSCYWSSTTNAANPDAAWCVDFSTGTVSNPTKDQTYFILPVRGGH
jgi:uncharacterized protein DUF1566